MEMARSSVLVLRPETFEKRIQLAGDLSSLGAWQAQYQLTLNDSQNV